MSPRRPDWWPPGLWPGGGRRRESPGRLPERTPGAGDGPSSPDASFLELVRAAFGARSAAVFRLEREQSAWVLDGRVGEPGGGPPQRFGAAGHPLTWCLREELVVQVETAELLGGRTGGWTLAGPVPGADRALLVIFEGSPPTGARSAVRAALRHLASLHEAGVV